MLAVKQGVPQNTPTPPPLERNTEGWKLALADVLVGASAVEISQADITDTRLNKELCGIIHGVIDQVDTTNIFNQYQDFFNTWSKEQQQAFYDWWENLDHIIDDDLAASLVLSLDAHKRNDVIHVSAEDRSFWDRVADLDRVGIQGNAGTATKLQTAREINGVAFDGTANITVTADPNEHDQAGETITTGTIAGARLGVHYHDASTQLQLGQEAQATGNQATALGRGTQATGDSCTALGYNAKATGLYATALGRGTQATGGRSTALGLSAQATGGGGTALGYSAQATTDQATALGYVAKATGIDATALGPEAKANGAQSIALGYNAEVPAAALHTMQLGTSVQLAALKCRVALTVTSDIRDKTDITEIPIMSSLDFIRRLSPIQYVDNNRHFYLPPEEERTEAEQELLSYYGLCDCYDKESYQRGDRKGERKRVGLSAQAIRTALAEVYGTSDYANVVDDNLHDIGHGVEHGVENQYTVAYQNLIPFLIGAIQAQAVQITALTERVSALEEV